jgi:hypothetical protein
MGTYGMLNTWLIAQPPHVNYIRVTLALIGNILGFALPYTARRRPQWWENNSMQHSQARAWLDAVS